MLTAIPDWVFINVAEGTGVMCPKCGELETRSWYSAAARESRAYLLSVHEPCKSAWVEYE